MKHFKWKEDWLGRCLTILSNQDSGKWAYLSIDVNVTKKMVVFVASTKKPGAALVFEFSSIRTLILEDEFDGSSLELFELPVADVALPEDEREALAYIETSVLRLV